MNFIVDRQRAFFEKGVEYLKPLTLREVAEELGLKVGYLDLIKSAKVELEA